MHTARNEFTILVAEDEAEVRNYLEMALRCDGYSVEMAEDGEDVVRYFEDDSRRPSAVLLDLVMPRKDGLEALRVIRRSSPDLPVIVVSGVSSPLQIVGAMKSGATDFITKPVDPDVLCKRLRELLGTDAAEPECEPVAENGQKFFGVGPEMRALQNSIPVIATSEVPVLIQGETGVGKEVLARELHAHSLRARRAFVKLNCAALPSELVESELFGYERGAFTGAFQRKPGMFEVAHGGTILLDEIGDMDFKLQAKLLQVLQDHEFQRLGGKETVRVDVRVLAATHRDLEKAIQENQFREDLYYRLSIVNLRVPPLRERRQDILPLAEILLKKHAEPGSRLPVISPNLKQALLHHKWPGNVRELENVVRRLLIFREPDLLAQELQAKLARAAAPAPPAATAIHPAASPSSEPVPILEEVTRAKEQAEAEAILAMLEHTHWNRKRAAALLKIDYKALLYKMKKLGIDGDEHQSAGVRDSRLNESRTNGIKAREAGSGTV